MNLYAYVANDPANRIDPDGELWWVVTGLVGGGADLAFQLWLYHGNWKCVDWGDVLLTGAASSLGYGAIQALGKANRGFNAARKIERLSKRNPTRARLRDIKQAEEEIEKAKQAAAAAAGALAAKYVVNCPEREDDCKNRLLEGLKLE